MSQKIADKLLVALRHLGVPNEFASRIADSVDFMGESNEESAERDNYEIVIIAKALKSLLTRHSIPIENSGGFTEATEAETVRISVESHDEKSLDDFVKDLTDTADYPEVDKGNERFWQALSKMPKFFRECITFTLPVLMTIGMILLTLVVVGLTASLLLLVLGVTVAGIAAFFIGLIYGVSQISTFPAAAYYEMGLGLALGGISALLIVVMYWLITKILPTALKAGIKGLYRIMVKFKKFKASMRQNAAKAE
ncbi:MAG: hypothetical protein IKW68_02840 [Clostridia bacterium]|nr:hypothetical protein [Clostridia bacterium]